MKLFETSLAYRPSLLAKERKLTRKIFNNIKNIGLPKNSFPLLMEERTKVRM